MSKKRREEILQVAFELFCNHGFKDMKMKDVAKELGVAHGLVYHYFKSKEELFDAVVMGFYQEKMKEVHEILSRNITPHEKLRILFDLAGESNHLRPIIEAIHDESHQLEVIQKLRKKRIEIMLPLLTDLIVEGTAIGEFTCRYPEEAARFLLFGEMGIKHGFTGSVEELAEKIKHFYGVTLGVEF